jgi:hypothetical protein
MTSTGMSPAMSMFSDHTPLFFGADARPIAQAITRRHPLALALYAVVFMLGMIFLTHFGYGAHTEADLFPGVSEWAIWGWKVLMVVGGGGALVVLGTNPRPSPHWPDIADLLHLEGIAAIIAAMGLVVYVVAIIAAHGLPQSGPALTVYGVIIGGHIVRAYQVIYDAMRLQRLAQLAEDANDDAP